MEGVRGVAIEQDAPIRDTLDQHSLEPGSKRIRIENCGYGRRQRRFRAGAGRVGKRRFAG